VRRGLAALVVLLAPLLLAASDPVGDVSPCPGVAGTGGGAPDLAGAVGEITELGTSVRFTLRFAEPLVVPDRAGKPFRVDIVLEDPDVPRVDAGLYRGVNRLLRYDAVADPITTILLLPEGGQSRFIAPTIEGDTFVLQVPGRTLTADEDETGTSPGLERLRWGVIVRDEAACDLLGTGRATERLVADDPVSVAPTDGDADGSDGGGVMVTAAGLAVLGLIGVFLWRRRAAPDPRS
jgi:MYXO-CTERM domain-containing protein